jgi:GAF domain-containing protein
VNGSAVEVEDARRHPVFKNYSVVGEGHVVAYLGMPLADDAGNTVGALNVVDKVPRQWSPGHVQILSDLAEVAAKRMFGG